MNELTNKGPIKTKCLISYYQSKNGETKNIKHYLQNTSTKKITFFANKINCQQSFENMAHCKKPQITHLCIEIRTNFECNLYLNPRIFIRNSIKQQ